MSTINTTNVCEKVYTVKVSDTGLKGRPGLVWRGDWDGTTTYYVGDVVKYNGSSWIATTYTVADADGYPNTTLSNWSLFTEKGDRGLVGTTISATTPIGSCSIDSYTDQTTCESQGGVWILPKTGDLWFDTSVGRLYSRVEDAQGDEVWFDISGVVGSMDASDIVVAADGDLPGGSLSQVLKHLEDEIFKGGSQPSGSTVTEGDLWYDTTQDRMKFYRNGVWETITSIDAMGSTTGYDDVSMNGGYF